MINDYGRKNFHFISESGEVSFEVGAGESVVIDIKLDAKFFSYGVPDVRVNNKKVEYRVYGFTLDGFKVEITNPTTRKKKGKVEYEVRGMRIWT